MTYRFKLLPVIMFTVLAMLVAACGGPPAGEAEPDTEPTAAEVAEPTEATDTEAEPTEAMTEEEEPTAEGDGAMEEPTAEGDGAMEEPTEDAMAEGNGAAAEPVADLGGATLTIGSDTTYPPMEFVNDDREIVGFDIDMMNAVAELINAEVEFVTFPNFDAIFAALAGGEFDMVVSSVSITEERQEIIDFSDPYLSIGQVISVQEGNDTITSVEDLVDGALVGVQGGTTGEQAALDAGVPAENIQRYDTIDLAFQDLANDAVDAVIADGPPSAEYTAQIEGLQSVGGPFTTEDYAIAFQKDTPELQEAVNAALQELKDNGTLDQLLEEWNLQDVAELP